VQRDGEADVRVTTTDFSCPKSMEYGPCAGIAFDGTCEVADHRCVFVDLPTVGWHGVRTDRPLGASDPVPAPVQSAGADPMRALLEAGRVVVADLPARALDAESIRECGEILSGRVDAVLAGDSGAARVQFPPAYRATLLQQAGLTVWTGINCRDRNRVAIEGELAALAHVGVAGIHSVTGDHTATGGRPDARPVFDLDSTELASVARAAGHLVSVAESPAAPPTERRADRLVQKLRAGAEVCFVNHAGGADAVRRFVAEVRELGAEPHVIACIPVVTDRESAELLASFTTLVLPEGYLQRILAAHDPYTEGIAAAVELGERMLALDGVSGVNLSGGPGPGRESAFAEALATIGERLR
jgi:5,10-methylenetetrahydrofolate reductase